MNIVAVMLSGGAGKRLGGVRKMDLRLGGERLLSRVRDRLTPQCTVLLLSVAGEVQVRDKTGFRVLPDEADGPSGPAGGLFAAAKWCRAKAPGALILTVAVDTPFFPEDFVARALPALEDADCAIGAYGTDRYPTNALWRRAALEAALAAAAGGARGPSLFSLVEAVRYAVLDYRESTGENPFANVNALPDLLALSRRL